MFLCATPCTNSVCDVPEPLADTVEDVTPLLPDQTIWRLLQDGRADLPGRKQVEWWAEARRQAEERQKEVRKERLRRRSQELQELAEELWSRHLSEEEPLQPVPAAPPRSPAQVGPWSREVLSAPAQAGPQSPAVRPAPVLPLALPAPVQAPSAAPPQGLLEREPTGPMAGGAGDVRGAGATGFPRQRPAEPFAPLLQGGGASGASGPPLPSRPASLAPARAPWPRAENAGAAAAEERRVVPDPWPPSPSRDGRADKPTPACGRSCSADQRGRLGGA